MFLAAGADSVGTYTLIGGLVTLFGLAVTVLIKAGDRSEERYQSEIVRLRADKDAELDRLRSDKDATIKTLRSELRASEADRDQWFRAYAEAKGLNPAMLAVASDLPGAGKPPSASEGPET